MKSLSALTLFLLSILLTAAQSGLEYSEKLWNEYSFNPQKLELFDIRKVDITSFSSIPHGRTGILEKEVLEVNDLGLVVREIELKNQDTTFVTQYKYNRHGNIGWKETVDKRWNRTYQEGIRFTSWKERYQVKSYELLNNDEKMLLDTRQYVYNSDSQLIEIKILQSQQVVEIHRFAYDEDGFVSTESFEDASHKKVKEVSYEYDYVGRVSKVDIFQGDQHSEFVYDYNPQGLPMQVLWRENGTVKALIGYEYNSGGMVARADYTSYSSSEGQEHFYKVFDYQSN